MISSACARVEARSHPAQRLSPILQHADLIMADFDSIPVLDWSLTSGGGKDAFLSQLRQAFITVGFCYLKASRIK